MPDVLLFGATGYTGTLTAEALGRRGVDFVVAGRSRDKLEALATATGASAARVAEVGDVDALTKALDDVRVMITCVGPFDQLGATAAEAALRAGVHYIDSTGESAFIDRLVADYGGRARDAGIVMAPAMGFDEVPADVAVTLATEGMTQADAVLTYSMPKQASTGTIRTIVANIAGSDGRWLKDGAPESVSTGSRKRWAPMPPPLGPKLSVALPFAIGRLAPMHLDLRSLELYGIVSRSQASAMKLSMPVVKLTLGARPVQALANKVLDRRSAGPGQEKRQADKWAVLAEARDGDSWRNVALTGTDVYGLTAETLAAGAVKLAQDGHDGGGVMAPVEAMGLETLHKTLIDHGVDVHVYEPA
ncbi:MAG: hypothetical protein QOG04_2107 [Actinomycetota bacterium]|jgi:short subunit dehydrogenase-like uncharacterized protein|nr:hypothetical protein [Actinomycetota bacterium]